MHLTSRDFSVLIWVMSYDAAELISVVCSLVESGFRALAGQESESDTKPVPSVQQSCSDAVTNSILIYSQLFFCHISDGFFENISCR